MEFAPIAGILVAPVVKLRPVDPEMTAIFDIESSARPGDDTYSSSGKKAAGAEEPEEEEKEEFVEAGESEPPSALVAASPARLISFFA